MSTYLGHIIHILYRMYMLNKKKLLEKMSGRLNNFFKNYVHNFSIIANSSEAFHTHQQFSFSRRTKIQISDANFFAAVAAMMMFIIKVFFPIRLP